ncbi:MAG TPA: hypothetical protein VFW07_28215 [Parafilimonas sp.]|nr:hypothetical protein [Parafilimonas sp.]
MLTLESIMKELNVSSINEVVGGKKHRRHSRTRTRTRSRTRSRSRSLRS